MNEKITDFLALNKNEKKLVFHLRKFPASTIATLSKQTRIPRMSIYKAIESLKKRCLIDFQRKGKRRLWSCVDDRALTSKLVGAVLAITESTELAIEGNNTGFTIFYGVDSLYKSWYSLKDLPPNTRVYGIQPSASIKLSIKKLNWEKIRPLQENILKKPIIIDGVLPEDYYATYAKLFAHDKQLQKRSLQSFIGRATDMTFVSKEYFKDSETELLILPSVAYITDWRNDVSIQIKNPIMISFLKELYLFAKGCGTKVNQNEYLKKFLSDLNSDKVSII